MNAVIAIKGKESRKLVGSRRHRVIPFVGADRRGEFAQLGLGLIFPDRKGRNIFWGLLLPHSLIQSWRGMKVLERVKRIDEFTLCACWYAGRREIHEMDRETVDGLAEQLGGIVKLETISEKVLASAPRPVELDAMIRNLRKQGVDVDSRELEEEIEAGRVAMSPRIKRLISASTKRRDEYLRQEEEVKRPLPREESLGAFFEDLGIANFIVGGGIGGYGLDWGHIKLDELDAIAKRDSFSKYLPEGHELEHTTQGPETEVLRLDYGTTAYMTSFGQIENPQFTAVDGTNYTFLSAKFRDGHFFIKTKIRQPEEEEATEGVFSVAALRLMIGPLPVRLAPAKRWLDRILAPFR